MLAYKQRIHIQKHFHWNPRVTNPIQNEKQNHTCKAADYLNLNTALPTPAIQMSSIKTSASQFSHGSWYWWIERTHSLNSEAMDKWSKKLVCLFPAIISAGFSQQNLLPPQWGRWKKEEWICLKRHCRNIIYKTQMSLETAGARLLESKWRSWMRYSLRPFESLSQYLIPMVFRICGIDVTLSLM